MTIEPADQPVPAPPLEFGATIGILGGGQLGRMLAMAAHRLGLRAHIYCPDPDSCAFDVTPLKTVAAYDDTAALTGFAAAVDAVTWEFENVPVETVENLATSLNAPGALPRIRGSTAALSVAQDRLAEKRFFESCGLAVAPWQPVESIDDLRAAVAEIGTPSLLKTRRLGYDGKGQWRIEAGDDLSNVFNALDGAPAILEGFVSFDRELSVILARGQDGALATYDPVENTHDNQILRTSKVPADVPASMAEAAMRAAGTLATALDYVGVMGVEFFVTHDENPFLVNEFAPRVHNSGHWTHPACATSQFDQHIRAVAGWPLGDPTRFADIEMRNLIGDEVLKAPATGAPGEFVEIYGKREIRPGRKMGHLVRLAPRRR
jgi:5-(carboxyamino)imidazole ribonucleotide synthase